MHTVDFALQLGKEVAAVPGPINSNFSIGTNKLIKNGAIPITSASDLSDLFSLDLNKTEPFDISSLSETEIIVYKALKKEAQRFNDLLITTGVHPNDLRITISNLEIANILAPTLNGVYALRR